LYDLWVAEVCSPLLIASGGRERKAARSALGIERDMVVVVNGLRESESGMEQIAMNVRVISGQRNLGRYLHRPKPWCNCF